MRPRGPVTYEQFRQRVRRHRRTDVLLEVAAVNAYLQRVEFDFAPGGDVPQLLTAFSLAGIARTALVHANEGREAPVGLDDLEEMARMYMKIDDPALKGEADIPRLRGLLNRTAYEQFGSQMSATENVGRSLALLVDHSDGCTGSPSRSDWRGLLGVTLEQFMRLGFAMHVAAASNAGQIERSTLRASHVAPIFGGLSPDEALRVVDRWYAASLDELRAAGKEKEVRGLEKWSVSPLLARPIVAVDSRYIIPWPRLVVDRFTPTGLYFDGLAAFGPHFPEALGCMFERYVGTQLGLLRHARVIPEIRYGRPERRTVDYFVVTPEAVVLIEVKSARPVLATRRGEESGDSDIVAKIGHALDQIDRTAQMIEERDAALVGIPSNLPVVGIVVTLEPFHLANTLFYADLLPKVRVPTVVASAHELEGFVAAAQDLRDVGARIVKGLESHGDTPPSLYAMVDDIARIPNPLIDDAWERFTKA